jgi:formylglycine-generating enzyme required for sulfatase activity
MSGNVWEWCLNEYKNPKLTKLSGSDSRVVRGGSWDLNQDDARAASRGRDRPADRNYSLGFRVVCSFPILP